MERSDTVGIINSNNEIARLDVMVTEKCNLSCGYCFHRQKPRDMSDRLFEDMVAFLKPYFIPGVVFNLFGGEPMLRAAFCSAWADRLKSALPKCGFMLSTNGTIYDPALIRKLDAMNAVIQISFDGTDQENQRGHTREVEKNIRRYIEAITKEKILVRMTFTRASVRRLSKNIIYIHEELGVNRVYHSAAMDKTWTLDDINEYGRQLDLILDYQKLHPEVILETCDFRKLGSTKKVISCGAGGKMLAVDAVGGIYPCHRIIHRPEARVGDVSTKMLARGKFLHMQLQCGGCLASGFCPACPVLAYENNGSYCEPFKPMCEMAKREFLAVRKALPADDITGIKTVYSVVDVLNDIHDNNNRILRKLDETRASQPA